MTSATMRFLMVIAFAFGLTQLPSQLVEATTSGIAAYAWPAIWNRTPNTTVSKSTDATTLPTTAKTSTNAAKLPSTDETETTVTGTEVVTDFTTWSPTTETSTVEDTTMPTETPTATTMPTETSTTSTETLTTNAPTTPTETSTTEAATTPTEATTTSTVTSTTNAPTTPTETSTTEATTTPTETSTTEATTTPTENSTTKATTTPTEATTTSTVTSTTNAPTTPTETSTTEATTTPTETSTTEATTTPTEATTTSTVTSTTNAPTTPTETSTTEATTTPTEATTTSTVTSTTNAPTTPTETSTTEATTTPTEATTTSTVTSTTKATTTLTTTENSTDSFTALSTEGDQTDTSTSAQSTTSSTLPSTTPESLYPPPSDPVFNETDMQFEAEFTLDAEYKEDLVEEMTKNVTDAVVSALTNIEGFKDVGVLDYREGSIIVDMQIYFEVALQKNPDEFCTKFMDGLNQVTVNIMGNVTTGTFSFDQNCSSTIQEKKVALCSSNSRDVCPADTNCDSSSSTPQCFNPCWLLTQKDLCLPTDHFQCSVQFNEEHGFYQDVCSCESVYIYVSMDEYCMHQDVVIIIGCVCGGILLIILISFTLVLSRKQHNSKDDPLTTSASNTDDWDSENGIEYSTGPSNSCETREWIIQPYVPPGSIKEKAVVTKMQVDKQEDPAKENKTDAADKKRASSEKEQSHVVCEVTTFERHKSKSLNTLDRKSSAPSSRAASVHGDQADSIYEETNLIYQSASISRNRPSGSSDTQLEMKRFPKLSDNNPNNPNTPKSNPNNTTSPIIIPHYPPDEAEDHKSVAKNNTQNTPTNAQTKTGNDEAPLDRLQIASPNVLDNKSSPSGNQKTHNNQELACEEAKTNFKPILRPKPKREVYEEVREFPKRELNSNNNQLDTSKNKKPETPDTALKRVVFDNSVLEGQQLKHVNTLDQKSSASPDQTELYQEEANPVYQPASVVKQPTDIYAEVRKISKQEDSNQPSTSNKAGTTIDAKQNSSEIVENDVSEESISVLQKNKTSLQKFSPSPSRSKPIPEDENEKKAESTDPAYVLASLLRDKPMAELYQNVVKELPKKADRDSDSIPNSTQAAKVTDILNNLNNEKEEAEEEESTSTKGNSKSDAVFGKAIFSKLKNKCLKTLGMDSKSSEPSTRDNRDESFYEEVNPTYGGASALVNNEQITCSNSQMILMRQERREPTPRTTRVSDVYAEIQQVPKHGDDSNGVKQSPSPQNAKPKISEKPKTPGLQKELKIKALDQKSSGSSSGSMSVQDEENEPYYEEANPVYQSSSIDRPTSNLYAEIQESPNDKSGNQSLGHENSNKSDKPKEQSSGTLSGYGEQSESLYEEANPAYQSASVVSSTSDVYAQVKKGDSKHNLKTDNNKSEKSKDNKPSASEKGPTNAGGEEPASGQKKSGGVKALVQKFSESQNSSQSDSDDQDESLYEEAIPVNIPSVSKETTANDIYLNIPNAVKDNKLVKTSSDKGKLRARGEEAGKSAASSNGIKSTRGDSNGSFYEEANPIYDSESIKDRPASDFYSEIQEVPKRRATYANLRPSSNRNSQLGDIYEEVN